MFIRLKYAIICALALSLAVGCQKDLGKVETSREPAWVNDLTLGVPIQFGGTNYDVQSKAEINSTNVRGTQFGVFAADLGAGDWLDVDGTPKDNKEVLLYNKVAAYQTVDGVSTLGFVTADGPVKRYYPLVTENNYTFYGYHTTSAKIADDETAHVGGFTDNSFNIDVVLGPEDILWAKTEASTLTDPTAPGTTVGGFNAAYSRLARKWYPTSYEDYYPSFTFRHLTTSLHFWAVAEDAAAEASLAGVLSVNDLSISNLPASATLCVASKDNPALEGTLVAGPRGTIYVQNEEGATEGLEVYPTVAGVEIGGGLFILPQASADMKFTFHLLQPDGSLLAVERDLPQPATGNFEIGKRYDFKIIIKSIEEIIIKAAVVDWETGFDPATDDADIIIG